MSFSEDMELPRDPDPVDTAVALHWRSQVERLEYELTQVRKRLKWARARVEHYKMKLEREW